MKRRRVEYTLFEETWIAARRDLPRRQLHAEFVARFGRTDVTVDHVKALCTRRGWTTGRTGCFEKGQASPNKGKRMPARGRSAEAQFRKGVRQGVAARLYKPIGTERISKDGYLERKIHDGLPLQSRWRAVHLIRWEKANGPVPEGHALKCLDGDRTNTDPANWVAVPRALLPRLNGRFGRGYDDAPAELKPTIMAIARLEHRAREAREVRHDREGKPQ